MNDFQEENINYQLCLLDLPGLGTIEANTSKLYLPSSSLKGKFRSSIMRKLADSSEENTDKEIVIVASNGSGKSYFFSWLLVYFEKVTRNFCDDIFSRNCLTTQNEFKTAYFIPGDKTESLERVNAAYQASLSVHAHNTYPNDSTMTRSYLLLANMCHDLGKVYEKFELLIQTSTSIVTEDNKIKYTKDLAFVVEDLINYENNSFVCNTEFSKYVIDVLRYSNDLLIKICCHFKIELILKKVLFNLIKIQYLSPFLARIYIDSLVNKLKIKLKLVYDSSDTLSNRVFIASVPP